MKPYVSKVLNLCLISTLALATILCCNFSATQAAAASHFSVVMPKTEKTMPACHAHRKKADAPTKSDCSCCISKQLQADQPTKISFNFSPASAGYTILDVVSEQSLVLQAKFNLAYLNGPPGSISNTPLYIHFRNFRI